ncbi:succinate---hydroxymethylglutarate CoA-transferase [Geosmithia morbida]|uniref:Succinate---hydroxymethylglutarate CoA-transferase n=1 Tax=Geosmithia morbida TaxID=1094350 RepID=A0A9P5D1A8_9HYPO|nr:succinate---hydroxymethylglutarate CoA-transferase [Geosmithia morbida]KAF4119660.1 succinate---hydroxymethylglutarate CoA-transferase [Geosmithia morbida]
MGPTSRLARGPLRSSGIFPSYGLRCSRVSSVSTVRFQSSVSKESPSESGGPLNGLKILDLSRILAFAEKAPYCTQILADYGADVIKVEAVGKGDDTRHWRMKGEDGSWKSDVGPISNYFSAVNRNKRSITLDLKSSEGRDIFFELARRCDVVVENFKPGTMERIGLGYEKLKEMNSQLIYASLSGYGTTGPYAARGGYDAIAGAEAGLLHVTGQREGPPVRPGLGIVDMATGLYLHGAILSALHARDHLGEGGQRVDASLFETQISLLINVGMSWLNMGIEAQRWGCEHPSIVPYDAFQTKDLYIVGGAANDAQFIKLSKVLGLEELAADERFSDNARRVSHRDELSAVIKEVFRNKTTAEWIAIFETEGLPFAPINNIEKAFQHPQIRARDMLRQVSHTAAQSGRINLIGPSVKFGTTKAYIRREPPLLGQHTEEILEAIGIPRAEAQRLRQQNVV